MGNRGKLIAAISLLVVAGGLFWIWGREPSALPNRVTYVDVESGEQYQFSQETIPAALPAKNKHGKAVLMPCIWQDGKLFMKERYARILKDELAEVNKHVDPKTFEVR